MIAGVAGVSRFHMVRAFAAATGFSVMRYVRARRLSEAARRWRTARRIFSASRWRRITALTKHSPARSATILASRRRRFAPRRASTPQASGADRHGFNPADNLKAPRFETGKALLVAGIGERCTHENGGAGIPSQWQRFHQKVDEIPDRVGKVAYGVCCNGDDSGNFDYIAGVEVSDFSDLPREFAGCGFPTQKYAVFTHSEHISTIRRTVNTIWNHWLPASGMKAADAPSFERYDEKFDPPPAMAGSRSGCR